MVLSLLWPQVRDTLLLVPAPQGMVHQRPMIGCLTIKLLQGVCIRYYTPGSYTPLRVRRREFRAHPLLNRSHLMTGFHSQRVVLLPLRDYLARLTTVLPQTYIVSGHCFWPLRPYLLAN